ncbi:hypothetical protein ABBQ32_011153 [Trebouxia sp. C0010 RCD-2024]
MQSAPGAYLLELPPSLLQQILAICEPVQLARCACTCTHLNKASTECSAWARHCSARWSTWASSRWFDLQERGAWKILYAARHEVDLRTSQLVSQLVWPIGRYQRVAELEEIGYDSLDELRRLAVKQGPLLVGTRYWAKQALTSVLSHLQAASMRLLVHAGNADNGWDKPETGALMVAQAHYPLVDVFAISSYLDDLAAECRARIAASGAHTDLERLAVLNQLMFSPPAGGRSEISAASDDTPRQAELPYPMSAWTWEKHEAAAAWMVVPTGEAGLGLQGDNENYYDPSNSLLPFVLAQKKGIPISLAIVHAAVGRRAGLPIEFVGMPMHFMNKLCSHNSQDERFIDVFAGGRILDRELVKVMMRQNDIPFSDARLQAVGFAEVYTRMCGNLVNIYSHSRNASRQRIMLDMLLAIAPGNVEYRIRRAQVAVNRDDYDTAIDDYQHIAAAAESEVAVPGILFPPSAVVQARLQAVVAMKEAWLQQCHEQTRRPSSGTVRFKVGDVIRHKRYHYRGVIYGWDPECKAEEEWMQQMRIDQLPGGRHQPYYHVLVDHRDRPFQSTYVAQENIVRPNSPNASGSSSSMGTDFESEVQDIWAHRNLVAPHWEHSLEVQHPDIGEYFEGIEPEGSCYKVNAFLNYCYPEDWIAAI